MSPTQVHLLSLFGSAGVVIATTYALAAAGVFDGWPTATAWPAGFAIGTLCVQFARWMRRRAERRELS